MISSILVSSADFTIDKKNGAKKWLSHLKTGQVIDAKVEKVLSLHHAELLVQGRKLLAKTYVPLKEGEKILLGVSKRGTEQIFKLIETRGKNLSALNQVLSKALDHSDPYEILSKILRSTNLADLEKEMPLHRKTLFTLLAKQTKEISLKSDNADQNFLKSLIKNSGLTWENRLFANYISKGALSKEHMKSIFESDLKAIAMKLMSGVDNEEGKANLNLKNFVEGIEKLQILNRYAFEESGRYLLPIPVLFDERLRFGQMLLELGHNEKKNKSGSDRLIKLSFLLEMSNMGNICADFSIFKNRASGIFKVANNDIRIFFEKNIPKLVNKLNKQNFKIQDIRCQVISQEAVNSISFIDKMIDNGRWGFNLVV